MTIDYAYTKYDIKTYGVSKLDASVEVYFETNDDGDTGYPGEFASDLLVFNRPGALEKALKHTGKSRQGVGQRVFVTLDGEEI